VKCNRGGYAGSGDNRGDGKSLLIANFSVGAPRNIDSHTRGEQSAQAAFVTSRLEQTLNYVVVLMVIVVVMVVHTT
jgi:hypothetical protein